MMGEWKHGLVNWLLLKSRLLQAARFELRQDPHSAPPPAGLLEQNPAATYDYCMRLDESCRFGPRISYGECSGISCAAKRFNRADIAFRLPGYANERAKIEKCGVESRGFGFWKKARRVLPKGFSSGVRIDGFAQIEKPRQNPSGVGLDDRDRLIEGKAGHRMRGVFPDSGKLSHLLDSSWEVSAMSAYHRFCRGVEISRAGVIPKALPRAKDLVLRSARQ